MEPEARAVRGAPGRDTFGDMMPAAWSAFADLMPGARRATADTMLRAGQVLAGRGVGPGRAVAGGVRRRPRLRAGAITLVLAWTAAGGLAPARADARPEPAALLVDAGSGAVLHAEDATRRWHPASLTKLMTVFLALEAVAAGRLALDEELAVSMSAATQPEFKLGLRPGRKIRARDAILAVLQRSANDAAALLAERLAGSEEAFAVRMTARARALGMTGTQFRNATGLPDPAQITTARDMALLVQALDTRFPEHAGLFATPAVEFEGRSLPTLNGLLVSFPGARTVKTGFTCDSGYNIVARAGRGERDLIAVVLGGRNGGQRNALAARLLSRGFSEELTPEGSLTDLGGPTGEPPRVLTPKECAPGASPTAPGPGRPPGGEWVMLVGTFPSQEEARAAARRARERSGGGGRVLVTRRARGGASAWTAALAGLDRARAGAACRKLWEQDVFCRPLPRPMLASEKARRRT